MSLSDYANQGDSVSLTKVGNNSFTITGIENSDYDDNGEVTPGVKITTKEKFEGVNKFHTTRVAIVKKLSNEKLRADVAAGKHLKVKCVTRKSKNNKEYFDLEDAE